MRSLYYFTYIYIMLIVDIYVCIMYLPFNWWIKLCVWCIQPNARMEYEITFSYFTAHYTVSVKLTAEKSATHDITTYTAVPCCTSMYFEKVQTIIVTIRTTLRCLRQRRETTLRHVHLVNICKNCSKPSVSRLQPVFWTAMEAYRITVVKTSDGQLTFYF